MIFNQFNNQNYYIISQIILFASLIYLESSLASNLRSYR
jgi:hypothetical protein